MCGPGEHPGEHHECRCHYRQECAVAARKAQRLLGACGWARAGWLAVKKPLEVIDQFVRGLIATLWLFFKEFADHRLNVARQRTVDAPERCWYFIAHHCRGFQNVAAIDRVRHASSKRLIEHHSKGVEIAARVNITGATKLLGGHVRHGAHQFAGHGLHGDARTVQFIVNHASDPEVNNLWLSTRGDKHVSRLEIAVNDATCMCMGNALCNVHEESEDALDSDVIGAHPRGQWDAVHEFHHKVWTRRRVAIVGACAVDARDVRVLKAPKQADLASESRKRSGIPDTAPQHLHRDNSVRFWLLRAQHNSACPVTNQAEYRIPADGLRYRGGFRGFIKHNANVKQRTDGGRAGAILQDELIQFRTEAGVLHVAEKSPQRIVGQVACLGEQRIKKCEAGSGVHGSDHRCSIHRKWRDKPHTNMPIF